MPFKSQAQDTRASVIVHTRCKPLLGGLLAVLITSVVLWWTAYGFFASELLLMMGSVIVHGVGTAVAMVLDMPSSNRTLRAACWRIAFAVFCALFLVVVSPIAYRALITLAPRIAVSALGVVVSSAIAYALCAAGASRVDLPWNRYAGPLALAVLTLAIAYVIRAQRLLDAALSVYY